MTDRRVRFVVFRYSHHSPHSGYSRTAEYYISMNPGEIITVSKPLPRSIIRERILWRLAKGTPGYDRAAMAAELKVAGHIFREPGNIYHFLYGETTYHYAGFLNNIRQNRVIATFHQPPGAIRQAVQIDWHIRQLSGVVCVGRNQQEYFSKILGADRVSFVPLGVDTDYYTPPATFESRDPDLCVFVGENYRDFPTLRGVIELTAFRRPQTKFVAVLPARSHERIGTHPNLTLYSGFPESQLLELYRSAALLIMPLEDATANNAILESMACGLPPVITDVGAVRDYVDPSSTVLTPLHDSRCMADVVLGLLDSPKDRKKMSEAARAQALNYSWPKVINRLKAFHAKIA